jgi:hypothetical protein
MSTKTTFKRIALVAVAALGFGMLSVVPSQAAVLDLALPVATNGNPTLTSQDTTTAGSITVSAFLEGGTADSVTVQIFEKSVPATSTGTKVLLGYLETTTAGTIVDTTAPAAGNPSAKYESITSAATAGAGFYLTRAAAGSVGAKFTIQLETGTGTIVAGSYVYTVIAKSAATGVVGASSTWVTKDVTLTIAAAAVPAAAVPAAANATAVLQAGNPGGVTSITDSVTAGSFLANGTPIGKIKVTNLTTGNLTANDTITAVMTGVGYLVDSATGVTGRSFTLTNVASATLNVLADGSSGTGTITITTVAGASFVKTVTFFDTKPVKAVATVAKAYIKAGTTASDDVFAITVTDTLGNAIKEGGVTVTAAPTDTATTVGGAATCAWNVKGNAYHCSVAGLSATKFGPVAYTIKATGTGVNLATVVSTSATVTFADNVATKAVLAGPATGTPGAEVEYTLTLTEKNGYPVADMVYGVGNAPGGVLFSATAADRVATAWNTTSPFTASDSFTSTSGVIKSKGILPLAGTASLSLTLVGDGISTASTDAIDKTLGKTKVTASTDVSNPGVDAATDAANEATDAANAATDAALAAAEAADAATTAAQEASDAVAALSETVTKLISDLQAQIKSLAAVVAKIAKKVKA